MRRNVYGAYASNMNIKEMKQRCPNAILLDKGILHGYRMTFGGEGFANIERSAADQLPILLWSITIECERALDEYEEYPKMYKKDFLPVATQNGDKIAMFYLMTEKYNKKAEFPEENYLEVIRTAYAEHGFPLEIVENALKRIEK